MAARSSITTKSKRSAARARESATGGAVLPSGNPVAAQETLLPAASAWWGILAFGIGTGLFAAFFIRPSVILYTQQPPFLWEERFFVSFLNRPGGLLEWLAAGLLQLHVSDLLGALVCTLIAVGLAATLRAYLASLGPQPPSPLFYFIPAAGIVACLGRYDFPWVDTTLGVIVSIGTAWCYGRVWVPAAWVRLGFCVFLAAGVYWLAAGQVILFGACVAVVEVARARNLWMAGAILALTAAAPWAATAVYAIHLEDAYLLKVAWAPRGAIVYPAIVIFILPPIAAATFWWCIRHGWVECPVPTTTPISTLRSSRKIKNAWGGHTRLSGVLWHPALPLLLVTGALLCLWRPDTGRLLEIGLRTQQKQWSEVLRLAKASGSYTAASVADTHRALANQGQLLDAMFAFPQVREYPLWLTLHQNFDSDYCMKASNMLFELGQVNKSERMAGEALELNGYLPQILERLALVNVLKNEVASARIFLNLMTKAPLGAAAAQGYLQALENDVRLPDQPELARVRQFQLTEDYYGDHQIEEMMQQSLDRNPRNQLALQYLFAHYLLELKLEAVENNLGLLPRAGVESIPIHCEEALLILQKLARGRPLQLGGMSIRPETVARYQDFHRRFMTYGGRLEVARNQMLAEFGNTYWFYYMFGVTGPACVAVDRGVRP